MPTEGDLIRLERQIQRDDDALRANLASVFCGMCGTRLDARGKCAYGCLDNQIAQAIIAANTSPVTQYNPRPRCQECHDFLDECEHGAPIESMSEEHIRNGEA